MLIQPQQASSVTVEPELGTAQPQLVLLYYLQKALLPRQIANKCE